MFLIDIPFKGCQIRSNRSSIVHAVSHFACGVNDTACTVHAVSMTPHVQYRAFGVVDTACMVHTVSLTPHAQCMRCQWPRMHTCQLYRMHRAYSVIDTACIFNFICITSPLSIWFLLFEVNRKNLYACGVNDTACGFSAVIDTAEIRI
jgi:hypothetical protein